MIINRKRQYVLTERQQIVLTTMKIKRCKNDNPETITVTVKTIKLHGERWNKCAVNGDIAI